MSLSLENQFRVFGMSDLENIKMFVVVASIFPLITLIFFYYIYVKHQRKHWPPGPFPYPSIGNLIEIFRADPVPYVGFQKLAKKYGNIFSFKMGVVPYIVVNGYKDVRQTGTSGQIDDRFAEEWILDRAYGSDTHGLFVSAGQAWKINRRFSLKTLKDVGFGKSNSMEGLIVNEMQTFINRLKVKLVENNGVLQSEFAFNAAFVNIIYNFMTGEKLLQDDPKLQELVLLSSEFFASQNIGKGVLGAYPFLKDWAPELSGFGGSHRASVKLLNYFRDVVESFRQKRNYITDPSNFIEIFLKRIDEGAKHDDYEEPIFTDKNLICLCNDLFSAGSETSSNVTLFAVRHLIQNPEIQAKLQEEVDRVIGRNRFVAFTDRPRLKYLEAFILEVLRVDNVGPISGRRTCEDFKVGSYVVPKGVNVLVNLYSANMDESVWDKPLEFHPERFLNVNGELINGDKIASFGYGKRDCIAQVIARTSIFVAFAGLVQNFNFEVDPATGPPQPGCTQTLTVSPIPFNTLVTVRP